MEKPSFEERLKKVRDIIEGIESGKMPLEESVAQFETGMQILNDLDEDLGEIKRRISILQETPAGKQEEVPMEEAL